MLPLLKYMLFDYYKKKTERDYRTIFDCLFIELSAIGLTKRQIKKTIESRRIGINGCVVTYPKTRVKRGDLIELNIFRKTFQPKKDESSIPTMMFVSIINLLTKMLVRS